MKGCLKFVVLAFALLCALSFGRYYLMLTPEQRAAEAKALREQFAAEEKQAAIEREASKANRARIDALKPEFIVWLQKNADVETARFKSGILTDVLEVKYDHGWSSQDEARVKAEALAHAWRLRSGLDYAECAIYWGNEIYATGVSR